MENEIEKKNLFRNARLKHIKHRMNTKYIKISTFYVRKNQKILKQKKVYKMWLYMRNGQKSLGYSLAPPKQMALLLKFMF